jgi:predicted nucleic acid-binding protein
LVALGFKEHEFFERVVRWVEGLHPGEHQFATCAIAKLGFVRVHTLPQYGLSVAESKAALLRLKSTGKINFVFLADDEDVAGLPGWVKTPKQVMDGHLAQLTRRRAPCSLRWIAEFPERWSYRRGKLKGERQIHAPGYQPCIKLKRLRRSNRVSMGRGRVGIAREP